MDYIQISEDLALIKERDCIILTVRDRESNDERRVFCKLGNQDVEKLRKGLGR